MASAGRHAAVLALLLLLTVASSAHAELGPCSSTVTTLDFSLPATTDCGWRCRGVLYVDSPAHSQSPQGATSACPYPAPYPLVVFISGFLAAAADYFAYSNHLASWGFAVLQYDFSLLPAAAGSGLTHTDAAEVGFLPHFLDALRAAADDPGSPLHQQLDLNNLGAAGHSRGAKIAALHFAGQSTPGFRAAFLVDPVDGTTATAQQPGYPSAVDALRGQGKLLGITGAGRIGPCNGAPCATGNWSSFWAVAGAGSWLEVVPDAGHLQFADISSVLDWLCCRGCQGLLSHKEGIALASVPLAAWFDQHLRPSSTADSRSKKGSFRISLSSSSSSSSSIGAGSSRDTKAEMKRKQRSSMTQGRSSSRRSRLLESGTSAAAGGGQGVVEGTTSTSRGSEVADRSSHGREGGGTGVLGGAFRDWVCEEEAAGKITFEVKGLGDVCVHPAAVT